MASSHYRVGTVSVTNGSKIVMGSGTKWTLGVNKPLAGDIFYIGFQAYEVEQIVSDTQLRLFSVFQGTTATGQKYAIWRNASLNISSRIAASVSMAINQKQKMLTELNVWMTDTTGPTVPLTDVFGVANQYVPLPLLIKTIDNLVIDASHITQIVNEGKQARDEAVNANQAVQQAKSAVDTAKQSVDTTKGQIDTIKGQIDTEAQTINTQHGEVNTWHSEVQSAASHVDTQKRAVDTAKSAIDTAKSDIDTKHGQINTWHTEAQQAASAATSAKNSVDATKGQIDTIKSGIDTKAATVATQHGEVDTWHTEVAANTNKAEAAKTAAETAAATAKSNVPYEFQYNKVRNALREIYDASGFINWGKQRKSSNESEGAPINEGMTAYYKYAGDGNMLWLGAPSSLSGVNGGSATDHAVINVAGHEIHLCGINHNAETRSNLRFQGAEDGTTVTDSTGNCRGSGKAVLNLKTDIDPKYGNAPTGTAAEIQREGVGRAFEGFVRNGDFRKGTTDWTVTNGTISVTNGVATLRSSTSNNSYANGTTGGRTYPAGTYRVKFFCHSHNSAGRTISVRLDNQFIASEQIICAPNTWMEADISCARSFSSFGIYGSSSNAETVISSFSIAPLTEDVLTRAVDLKYLEFFLEEDELEFFPYGSVQSGLTTVDGFTTEASSRPDTYRAVFLGDTASSKQCLKIAKLSFVEIAKLMSNPKHNWFYNEAGKPTQVRYRDCARRGAGNGDWGNVDQALSQLGYNSISRVPIQAGNDTVEEFVSYGATNHYYGAASSVGDREKGVFTAYSGIGTARYAYKGEAYALVLCTVPRLNMGAYSHLNPFGANRFLNADGGGGLWYQSSNHKNPTNSLLDCFVNAHPSQGVIGSASGHPDGLFHDAIYASGFNGVIDHRQPAKSPQDNWKESLQGYYAAKVRGVQKLPFTKFISGAYVGYFFAENPTHARFNTTSGSSTSVPFLASGMTVGTPIVAYQPASGTVAYGTASPTEGYLKLSLSNGNKGHDTHQTGFLNALGQTDPWYFAIESELDTSVSGAFSCNTVIADPANWVQTPQISQGVIGVWCSVIPDGTSKPYQMVRKCLDLPASPYIYSRDSGATWTTNNISLDSTKNSFQKTASIGEVAIVSYKAYAYQVEDGENLKPVEVAPVNTFNFHRKDWGALFHESALHKINVNDDSSASLISSLALLDINRYPTVRIDENFSRRPKHAPLSLSAPTNDSPACKALPFLAEKNGYLYIAWHVNELVWKDIVYAGANGTLSQSYEAHKIYRITDGAFKGKIVQRTASTNAYILDNDMFEVGNGDLVHISNIQNGNPSLYSVNPPVAGWGDDSKIKVTSKGWDTFVDLNGNKMTRRVVVSAFPIGPAKKKTLVGGLSSPA
ncbi:hypothetical protein [Vibrio sp. ER1A]|uniref:hypothetical protein n=1 Tax=Vibrio sp. ER1A TaxID=1517681 RepID=UPI0004DD0A1E|nr:hypothetical protein [Vibrio sp. ER1A]KFA99478.1 hypothetical protein HW45_03720 [Vibrio sp. ER1A]